MENLTLKELGQIVYNYCGLNYLSNLPSLEMKTHKRVTALKLNSLGSYLDYLKNNDSEWEHLVEVLTINETYFYREDKQLTVYQNSILPQLKATLFNQPVKIWSAACSTGEEPYSLAMMTLDAGLFRPNTVKITATDINQRVLTIAKKATYNKRSLSFRRIPQRWLQQYFNETSTEFELKDSVKEMVSFHYLNLLDEANLKAYEQYDVIFCRNVLIYFDEETIKKVVTTFYNKLKKGGYLFLGHAETISKLDIGFETMNNNGTFYYRKG